jgi:hypothetical protein
VTFGAGRASTVAHMAWPPKIGELLPRAAEAWGMRDKLLGYSLNPEHASGGPKARGFERILGITPKEVERLEAAIRQAILEQPITGVRVKPPYGVHCEVRIELHGLGAKANRVALVLTAWELTDPDAAPRLMNAYITD